MRQILKVLSGIVAVAFLALFTWFYGALGFWP